MLNNGIMLNPLDMCFFYTFTVACGCRWGVVFLTFILWRLKSKLALSLLYWMSNVHKCHLIYYKMRILYRDHSNERAFESAVVKELDFGFESISYLCLWGVSLWESILGYMRYILPVSKISKTIQLLITRVQYRLL